MPIKRDLPHRVKEISHLWVPLASGIRLAARLWLPENANEHPVPVIIEYIPYRKSDGTAISDSARYRYLAGHGYACLRVDIRGSGDSDGLLADEYTRQELDDGCELIEWASKQSWCTGRVGLTGISWGGFNSLQIAAPGLAAIIAACVTDDRYRDDVHYIGGSVLANDMLSWATSFMSVVSRPPDPAVVGDSWRSRWLERLQHLPHFIEPWLSHQSYDGYWQHGSVCEDYAAIECPVFLVGGWADAYTNAIFRLLENLRAPTLGLVGPWAHGWPNNTAPGPAIGYLQESLRWWDHWLKGIENGIPQTPKLRYWLQEAITPATSYTNRPGSWQAEKSWPSNNIRNSRLYLGDGSLSPDRSDESTTVCTLKLPSNLTQGQASGVFCPFGGGDELPGDQSADDELALSLEGEEMEKNVSIVGCPALHLYLTATQASGQIAARLCDVAPDDTSLLISRSILNLKQQPVREITLKFDATAHHLKKGHRLRLNLAVSYWPIVWPTPQLPDLEIEVGSGSRLVLPVTIGNENEDITFEDPETAAPIEYQVLDPPASERGIIADAANGDICITERSNHGHIQIMGGTASTGHQFNKYEIRNNDPLTASVSCECSYSMTGDNWALTTRIESQMTCDESSFHVRTELNSFDDGELFFNKRWDFSVPRED